MTKTLFAALLFSMVGTSFAQPSSMAPAGAILYAAASTRPTQSAATPAAEAPLRAAVEAAVWPADIVRAADAYLQAFPGAGDIAAVREAAVESRAVLRRSDVALHRSSFETEDPAVAADIRLAARGDRAAAVRMAQSSREHDARNGTRRYVGWMQFASLLGDEQASYQLALYFRREGQMQLSAQYESRALELGYKPAPSLDHRR